MAKAVNLPGERLAGLFVDLARKIQHGVIPLDELAFFINQRHNSFEENSGREIASNGDKGVYLERLETDAGEKIVLGPTDGKRTICQADDVFKGFLDPKFMGWNLNVPSRATEEVEVCVHKIIADGSFKKIYGSIGRPLAELCLTQSQIIDFCVKHRGGLLGHRGYGTFFLFDVNDLFFVANVGYGGDGRLNVKVYELFGGGTFWRAGFDYRFVLPQSKPSLTLVS